MTDSTTSPILVTGGTGRSGRRVAAELHAAGRTTRIASRSGVAPFHWDDPTTWDAALTGVDTAYVCFSPDLALPGADVVIEAFAHQARKQGVERMVLMSGRGEAAAQHCEQIVFGALPQSTVVRCAWFQENFSEHFLRDFVLAGTIALPAGQTREPFVSLDDVAAVAARALLSDAYAGQVLELTGPEAITFDDVAALISAAGRRPVEYAPISGDEFAALLVEAGVDRAESEFLAWLMGELLDGRNAATTGTVERVLGRPATSFEAYAGNAAASWRVAA